MIMIIVESSSVQYIKCPCYDLSLYTFLLFINPALFIFPIFMHYNNNNNHRRYYYTRAVGSLSRGVSVLGISCVHQNLAISIGRLLLISRLSLEIDSSRLIYVSGTRRRVVSLSIWSASHVQRTRRQLASAAPL